MYTYSRIKRTAGRKGRVELFESKSKAAARQAEVYAKARKARYGLFSDQDLKKYTVDQIIYGYIIKRAFRKDDLRRDKEELREELRELTQLPSGTFYVLWSFAYRDVASLTLYDFDKRAAEKYRDDRLQEPRKVHPNSKVEPRPVTPRRLTGKS